MTTAMVLAVAVLTLPPSSAATERMTTLLPVSTRRGRSGRPVASATGMVRRMLDRVPGRPAVPADPETMYRLCRLLAVALRAGLPPQQALGAVADALLPSDPEHAPRTRRVAEALRVAAGRIRLGTPIGRACCEADPDGLLCPIGEVLGGAASGGSGAGPALEHTAERLRAEATATAQARVERAGVLVAGPLGLCFLPAFVCLGVVPVVAGLAGQIVPGVLP